jgi:general secretion pathway protein D
MLAFLWISTFVAAQDTPKPPEQPKPELERKQSGEDSMFLEKSRVEHKDGRVTYVYQVGSGIGAQIKPLIEQFKSPQGWIFENAALNLLVITDVKESAEKIAEILRAALTPEPQVRIEAQVIEVRWTKEFQLGFFGDQPNSALWIKSATMGTFFSEARLNYRPAAALAASPFIGSGFKFFDSDTAYGTFSGVVETFVQRGRAEIKSNPSVWVKTGQEATIQSGEEVPFPNTTIHPGGVATTGVSFRQTGVELKVRPHVVSRDFVSLEISQSVSASVGRTEIVTTPGAGTVFAPLITTRSLKTTVIARNAEEVVIGGLIRKESTEVRRGLPLLMDIPYLGFLFSRTSEEESNTELIFIIKPVVYPTGRDTPRNIIGPKKD